MKFISLTCPYCGGRINLYEDHKFGECLYCNHKIMLVNDEVKPDERSDSTFLEFESVRYFIESGDVSGGSKTFAEKYRDNPNSAHGWLLCGYLQLMGCKPFEDTNVFKKMMTGSKTVPYETRLQTAFSSWKRGFSVLDNPYYLTDYCKAIGLALSSDDVDSDDKGVIPHLEDIKESIESHFNMSFSADFYYYVLKGYLRRKGTKEFYESDDLAFELMARAIMYERDVDALAIKSQLLNSNGIFNEFYIKKYKCVFFLLSLIYRQMAKVYTEEQKNTIRNGWNETDLYSQNSQYWKSLMTEDYNIYDKDQLKYIADNIDEFISFDDSEGEEDPENDVDDEEIDLKQYEHIEEEEPTLKQKLSKKRFFTQYIVIDGTFYSRGLELSRKEFDGDIERKSDLEKLKTLFEEYYEDVVVGAESCYEKYTPDEVIDYFDDDDEDYDDDDEDYDGTGIDEELNEFCGNCIEYANILESKLN